MKPLVAAMLLLLPAKSINDALAPLVRCRPQASATGPIPAPNGAITRADVQQRRGRGAAHYIAAPAACSRRLKVALDAIAPMLDKAR